MQFDHLSNTVISLTQKTLGELWFFSVPAAVPSVPPHVPYRASGNFRASPQRAALQQGLQEIAQSCREFRESLIS